MVRSSELENNTHTHSKMDKRRLRVTLKVLDEVRICFPDTEQFIEDSILIKNV